MGSQINDNMHANCYLNSPTKQNRHGKNEFQSNFNHVGKDYNDKIGAKPQALKQHNTKTNHLMGSQQFKHEVEPANRYIKQTRQESIKGCLGSDFMKSCLTDQHA